MYFNGKKLSRGKKFVKFLELTFTNRVLKMEQKNFGVFIVQGIN